VPTDRTEVARKLRKNATDAEKVLWRRLREAAPSWRIRRQHPIGGFIADFAVSSVGLVIEIDGGQHAEQIEADAARTEAIEAAGWRVIRFWNNEVLENTEGVIETILRESTISPSPPGRRRGRGMRRDRRND